MATRAWLRPTCTVPVGTLYCKPDPSCEHGHKDLVPGYLYSVQYVPVHYSPDLSCEHGQEGLVAGYLYSMYTITLT